MVFKLYQKNKILHQTMNDLFQQSQHNNELTFVENKLNPHLFKNILNSIQSHAYQSYYTIDKLANVLDYVLYETNNQFVTPYHEMEFAKNFIEINKIKLSPLFDLKSKFKFDENDALLHQKVLAPLICIDLIENAFKHADIQSEHSFISIQMELSHGFFILTVSNKISQKPPLLKPHSGIGGQSLETRLQHLYFNKFKLERVVQDEIFNAYLKIDLRNGTH
ncbi:histidine kinase [Flavobacterium agricola]|uniref:histidine kinase n=1 Tax=Flavobacterium agricola TaxID=2870839 RepID=UPI0022235EAA|nr:sensor histidine kinase [Flavobacterium agricola]